jgi:type I restriction enzyme S subunit
VCDKVYRIRTRQQVAFPAFLELVLNSPPILRKIDDLKTGISDSGVNLTQKRFRELRVPIPSLKTQASVVAATHRMLSIADSSLTVLDRQFARAARLRQSILKRAFEGKLVRQDPNDEPADVLLERIRAARAAESNGRKKQTGSAKPKKP